ncbi:MAG: ATP-binding cassette domain-containing protein [Colwellia sp.]|nr:ATP-binding cassette domain-containing protein [Colwellia sp.]
MTVQNLKVNIQFSNLKKTYKKEPALHIPGKVEIYAGQITTVLGYSASGKSTLLNLLALIDKPDKDTESLIAISYKGIYTDVKNIKEKKLNNIRKKHYGFIFQSGHLLSHFKVYENIAVPLYLNNHNILFIQERVGGLLEKVFPNTDQGKNPKLQYPRTLSGGQYIRTAVMRGISHDPTILFADEPTGSLDPVTGKKIMDIIIEEWMQERIEEKSLIMVTHDYGQAYHYSDRILVLADGRLVMDVYRGQEDEDCFIGKSFRAIDDENGKEIEFKDSDQLLKAVEDISGKTMHKRPDRNSMDDNIKIPGFDVDSGTEGSQSMFPFKYALKELIYNYKMSIMNLATVSILVLSALVIGGVLLGADREINTMLYTNPLLKRLILYASSNTLEGKISDSVITKDHIGKILSLKSELGSLKFQEPKKDEYGNNIWPRGNVIAGAFPFTDSIFRFYTEVGELTEPLSGRTVNQDDPLLGYLEFTDNGYSNDLYTPTFFNTDSLEGSEKGYPFGIIISRSTMEKILKYGPSLILDNFSNWGALLLEIQGDTESLTKKLLTHILGKANKIEKFKTISENQLTDEMKEDIVSAFNAIIDNITFYKDEVVGSGMDLSLEVQKGLNSLKEILEESGDLKKKESDLSDLQKEDIKWLNIAILKNLFPKILSKSLKPESVCMSYAGGRKVSLELVGVATNIPEGSFLVTDYFQTAFNGRYWITEDLFNTARLGPFSKETSGKIKDKIENYILWKRKKHPLLSVKLEERFMQGEYWFTFFLNSDDKSKLWTKADYEKNLYAGLRYKFPYGAVVPGLEFDEAAYNAEVSEDIEKAMDDQIALTLGVYFNDIEDIIKAPEIFRELNLGVKLGNIESVKQIIKMRNFGFLIFIIVFVLVGFTAGLNIFLSFFQSIQNKISEIGILRAIGASKWLVQRFYLLEALFIWLFSIVIGLGLSMLIGPCGGAYMSNKYEIPSVQPLFYLRYNLISVVLAGSFLLCIFGTYFAVRSTISKITPAELVRYQGN